MELYRRGDGWSERGPARCPNGHPLGPNQVLVGSQVCSAEHAHHRTHECRRCGAILYTPPPGPECGDGSFDGRARS